MADSAQKDPNLAKPGAALKRLRFERGLTLADVAEMTGLPAPTLSKVENGKVALTFDKLVRISEGLNVDIAELVGSTPKKPQVVNGATRRSAARAGEGKRIEMQRGNYLYLATELLDKRMVPIIGEVLAKDISKYGELMRHHGEEFVYVIEGTLDLHIELYTPLRLEKGDSVYFDSGMAHAYIAVGDKPCRILSICATSDPDSINLP
jgi:transcriptional regulator with XRE-family HTH domain